jgi:hypothetical protein
MRARLAEELDLLRHCYPDVEHKEVGGEDWFRLPRYAFPAGWEIGGNMIDTGAIVFKIGASYPIGEPYGFATPAGIAFKGAAPGNTGSPVSPPFDGEWQHFSWAPDSSWAPNADPAMGSNLLAWTRSFAERLREGA